MNVASLRLGQAMAILEAELQNKKAQESYSIDEGYLKDLRHRTEALASDSNAIQNLIQSIPLHTCFSEQPFLAENVDFFLVYFFVLPTKQDITFICERLWKHLNDCYRCFQAYAEVMRDYCNTHVT